MWIQITRTCWVDHLGYAHTTFFLESSFPILKRYFLVFRVEASPWTKWLRISSFLFVLCRFWGTIWLHSLAHTEGNASLEVITVVDHSSSFLICTIIRSWMSFKNPRSWWCAFVPELLEYRLIRLSIKNRFSSSCL